MITSISTSYKNKGNIFNQINFNNVSLSLMNSSNASTMMSGSDSLIIDSIKKNRKIITFQKMNRKLKNDIKNIKRYQVELYSYRDLNLQKSLNIAKNKEDKSEKIIKRKMLLINDDYSKIKREINNIDKNSSLSNKIIEQVYENKDRYLSKFNSKIKKIILFKRYIYDLKQDYLNKLKDVEKNELLIISYNQKIQNINFIIKELDNILTLCSYVKFLKELRFKLINENMEQFTKIDYLKNDINELLIKVKLNADKLADLINIRNLLVCIKENILMKDLPINFTFYIDNYKSVIDIIFKMMNNYYYDKISQNEYNNIPTNLVEYVYIQNKDKIDNSILTQNWMNYLNLNFPIFKDENDFNNCFTHTEKRIFDFFIFVLNQKNENTNSDIDNDINEAKIEEMNYIKKEEIIERKIRELEEIKERNIFLHIYLQKVKAESISIKRYKIDPLEKENELRHLNKLVVDSTMNKNSMHNVKLIYKFTQLKKEMKYPIRGSYIYHTLMKNILDLYNKYPEYITNQLNIQMGEFKFRINNFKNIIKTSSFDFIMNEIFYLLCVYESAISYIMSDYNKDKIKPGSTDIFNKINENIFNTRKKNLFRFRFVLEEKLFKAKIDRVYRKQSKNVVKNNFNFFPEIPMFKLRRNKSQENIIMNKNRINFSKIKK